MVRVGFEAGLRPWEVKQASVEWVDADNWVLQIPKEAGEERSVWKVALSEETAAALRGWLCEREQYEKYDGTDTLWLTRQGNQYGTKSLNYLFDQLCDEAGIETEERNLSWTSLRDTVGVRLAKRMNLAEVREQLRHESEQAVEKYRLYELEQIRDSLNEAG